MPRDRASRVLDEFSAVTSAAPRPDSPAERIVMRSRFPVATLSMASLVVVAVAVAAIVLGRSGPSPAAGSSPAPSTVPSAPVSVASAESTIGPCVPTELSARVTLWEGAAGQRIADVELTNRGTTDCLLDALARPQLVGGDGGVLIDGKNPSTSGQLTVAPGALLKSLVAAGNYCKSAPIPPVSVAFVFADGRRLVADPVSPADVTLPPCNGAGVPATISMHAWAP